MRIVKNIMAIWFAIFSFLILDGTGFGWDDKRTHKDITGYAVDNSVLDENNGNYLDKLGFEKAVDEKFK